MVLADEIFRDVRDVSSIPMASICWNTPEAFRDSVEGCRQSYGWVLESYEGHGLGCKHCYIYLQEALVVDGNFGSSIVGDEAIAFIGFLLERVRIRRYFCISGIKRVVASRWHVPLPSSSRALGSALASVRGE